MADRRRRSSARRRSQVEAGHDARRPVADWDDDRSAPPGIVWWSRLDERYLVEVRRLPGRRVLLLAFDHLADDALVVRRVAIMIGEPRYGPDPDDVRSWQAIVETGVRRPGDLAFGRPD